jgi:hypothetical protein
MRYFIISAVLLILCKCLFIFVILFYPNVVFATNLKDTNKRKIAEIEAFFEKGIVKHKHHEHHSKNYHHHKGNKIYFDNELETKFGKTQKREDKREDVELPDKKVVIKQVYFTYECVDGIVIIGFDHVGYTPGNKPREKLRIFDVYHKLPEKEEK